jgi:hypothetical protein
VIACPGAQTELHRGILGLRLAYPASDARAGSRAQVRGRRSRMGRCRSTRVVSREQSPLARAASRASARRFEGARTKRRSPDGAIAIVRARSPGSAPQVLRLPLALHQLCLTRSETCVKRAQQALAAPESMGAAGRPGIRACRRSALARMPQSDPCRVPDLPTRPARRNVTSSAGMGRMAHGQPGS